MQAAIEISASSRADLVPVAATGSGFAVHRDVADNLPLAHQQPRH
jgi:hypothetical protein